jgi:hypothetical protein
MSVLDNNYIDGAGTQIWFISDAVTGTATIYEIACIPDQIAIAGDSVNTVDLACLASAEIKKKSVSVNFGTMAFTNNFFVEDEALEALELEMQRFPKKDLNWLIGYSDGTTQPTQDASNPYDFATPSTTSRSWGKTSGSVASLDETIPQAGVVSESITIQRVDYFTKFRKVAP